MSEGPVPQQGWKGGSGRRFKMSDNQVGMVIKVPKQASWDYLECPWSRGRICRHIGSGVVNIFIGRTH